MIFTMIKMLLSIVLGVIYLPLNLLLLKVSDLYTGMERSNPLYWFIRIIIFPLWLIVAILSAPYEILVEHAH